MKAFYDKIVPNAVSKLVKKLDKSAKVERIGLDVGETFKVVKDLNEFWTVRKPNLDIILNERGAFKRFNSEQEAKLWAENNMPPRESETLSIQITPKMREKILEGQTTFAKGGAPIPPTEDNNQGLADFLGQLPASLGGSDPAPIQNRLFTGA